MKNFTLRSMRKGYRGASGKDDRVKQMAFRRAAQRSKRFIHHSASALNSPRLANQYADWCRDADKGALRK